MSFTRVVIGYTWKLMYDPEIGLANTLLEANEIKATLNRPIWRRRARDMATWHDGHLRNPVRPTHGYMSQPSRIEPRLLRTAGLAHRRVHDSGSIRRGLLGTMTRARLARMTTMLAVGAVLLGTLAPAVAAAGGLTLTTPYPAVAVAPGSKVSFDITVASGRAGTVALAVDGVPTGWTATLHGGGFVVDGVAASPGKDATVRLDVAVPGDATGAARTIRVTGDIRGTRAVLPITIRVNAAAAGDITLTTTTPTLTGASDATFPFSLTLQNDTAQDVTVSASATTDATGWDVKAEIAGSQQAAATVVKAGSSTTISVTATPAKDAPAGVYKIHIEAKAGDRTIPGDLGVQITGSYSMTLATPNQLLSGHGAAGAATQQQFVVTNTGTAPLTGVKLSEQAPIGWKVTYDPATVPDIAPGQTGTLAATITPSGEAVAGDYVVSFKAANDRANSSADIRFTVETSPIWAFVGIGIIIAILAGLFYVFRTYGRR